MAEKRMAGAGTPKEKTPMNKPTNDKLEGKGKGKMPKKMAMKRR